MIAGLLAASALVLPPTCTAESGPVDATTPIEELRRRVEAVAESDPDAAIRLLCATIPRVARERGEDSVDLAWWVASLATPLIAYRDAHAEAIPLLEFARPIFEKRLGPDAGEVAEIHVAYAWMRFRQGRLAESRDAWREALRVRENNPGPRKIELQKVLVGLAQAQLALREFDAARVSLARARGILEENGETVSEAAAAIENAFTNLEIREERFVEARRHAEEQIAIETRLKGEAPQLVPAYALLGQVLERLDEYEEAERVLREAVRLAESRDAPLQRHLLAALTLLGSFLDDRGKPAEALAFEKRALDLGTATLGADAPKLVRVLVHLAEAHRALGELPEALRAYERAAAIVERSAKDVERQTLVAYHRGRGALLLDLGDLPEARASLSLALEATANEPTLSTDRAAVLTVLSQSGLGGATRERRSNLLEALSLYRMRLPDSHPTILRVVNDLCGVALEDASTGSSDCDDAVRRLASAREVEPALREAVHGNRSRLAELSGEPEAALDHAVRAVAAAAALGTPSPLWRAEYRLARLLRAGGDDALAVYFGKESIAQIERLRGGFLGTDRRLDRDFLRDKVAVYRSVADWLLESERVDEGLAVMRLLKSEELYDLVRRGDPAEPAVAFTEAEAELRRAMARALDVDAVSGAEIDRLARRDAAGRLSVREREQLALRLDGQSALESARAARLSAFLRESSAATRNPPEREPSPPAELSRLAARLGPDAALAVYLVTDTHVRLLVSTRRGDAELRIPVDGRALRRDVGALLEAVRDRRDVRQASHVLYTTLAKPVDDLARRAGAERLVLWLDGALRYLPFAALHDGDRWLGERYAIELLSGTGPALPSAPPTPRVRGFGVTRAVAGHSALPAVAAELCSVVRGPVAGLGPEGTRCAGALDGEGFADAAFDRATVDASLSPGKDFSVLHVGTHFRLRPGNALRSYLVLGDGTRLTLDAVAGLDFGGVEVLTLSSCETALGGADGAEVEGLGALVARRGARSVVASLWEVEDSSTATLMAALYGALRDARGGVAAGLRRAQETVRRVERDGGHPWAHPYYWAGFTASVRY